MNFNRYVADASTNGRGLKVGPGPQNPGPPQSLRVVSGTPLKFKSGTPGPLQRTPEPS